MGNGRPQWLRQRGDSDRECGGAGVLFPPWSRVHAQLSQPGRVTRPCVITGAPPREDNVGRAATGAVVSGGLGGTAHSVWGGTHCTIVVKDLDPEDSGRPAASPPPGPPQTGQEAPRSVAAPPFSWQRCRKRSGDADNLIQETPLPATAPEAATRITAPAHQESSHWAAM